MSPIKVISSTRVLLLLLVCISLSACGDPNNSRTFDPETGTHPENWILSKHKDTALATGVKPCFDCHGENGVGGTSNVACNNCHMGGPLSLHPVEWGSGISNLTLNHGAYMATHNGDKCATVYCHGTNWEGSTGPACTACHN
jgi:hypothetical protein